MPSVPEMNIDTDTIYRVTLGTPKGTIVMDLDPQLAPVTVNNFVNLARDGYYTGLTFHRVTGLIRDVASHAGSDTGTSRF